MLILQAVLSLFNDRVLSAIHAGVSVALSEDVPNAVNSVLASLPTHVVVQASGDGVWMGCGWGVDGV